MLLTSLKKIRSPIRDTDVGDLADLNKKLKKISGGIVTGLVVGLIQII